MLMKQYAVFLRGINVGGNATIPMGELKALLSGAGYIQVETFLNSGNVLLGTTKNPEETGCHIEQLIQQQFGLTISVFIRSREELEHIMANNPFDPEAEADNSKRMVALFHKAVTPGELVILRNEKEDADYYLKDNLLYIYYKVGAGRAKITHPLIKQLFKQVSTSRNWNTITKILAKMK